MCIFRLIGCLWCVCATAALAAGQESRAPVPVFTDEEVDKIFFPDLRQIFPDKIPDLASLKADQRAKAANARQAAAQQATSQTASDSSGSVWAELITPSSIEDEIKRLRLRFDSSITTPGAFKSGGFQDARVDLTAMATLFAVITDFPADVRWKKQAANARDALARTATNCKSGSGQVYNEVKRRREDLQDLISGAGFAAGKTASRTDWGIVANRTALMIYAQELLDALDDQSRDADDVKSNSDDVLRDAELLAVIGEVLVQEGLDDAGDEDYDAYSRELSTASKSVSEALRRNDFEAAQEAAAKIESRCDACHADYR